MTDPILRAVECPERFMPSTAAGLLKAALANGWVANATLAIGFPNDTADAVKSVVVWCRKDGVRIHASWERPADDSAPYGFRAAYRFPGAHGVADKLSATEAKAAIIQ